MFCCSGGGRGVGSDGGVMIGVGGGVKGGLMELLKREGSDWKVSELDGGVDRTIGPWAEVLACFSSSLTLALLFNEKKPMASTLG
jgi:hypothetical protein